MKTCEYESAKPQPVAPTDWKGDAGTELSRMLDARDMSAPAGSEKTEPRELAEWYCPVCHYVMTDKESKGYVSCPTGIHTVQHVRLFPSEAKSSTVRYRKANIGDPIPCLDCGKVHDGE